MSKRPTAPISSSVALAVKCDSKGRIWSPIRQDWFVETPEERVRQEYVCTLFNEYEYTLDQMTSSSPS